VRILVIHNYYSQRGGERAAVEAEIALLRERGHRISTYTRDNAEIQEGGIADRVRMLALSFYSNNTYRDLKTIIREQHPQVAHVHNVFPLVSPSAYRALADEGVPIVQTIHNYRFLCPNGLFYTQGEVCERCISGNTLHAVRLKCYRDSYVLSAAYASILGLHRNLGTFDHVDRFVALTAFVARKLIEGGLAGSERIRVLGNFLPDPLPEVGVEDTREPYVLYLGRLAKEKGVGHLLAAASDMPRVRFRIAGDGPMGGQLQASARRMGLSNVEFLGRVGREKKWDLLRRSAATVVPSLWYECFPIVALESMAVGTPVVASRLGSIPSVLEDGTTGLLFAAGDTADLIDKLGWIDRHSGEALMMGRRGRTVVEQRYSSDAHYRGLADIYSEVAI
jgi:glycosyltransferase involved in cell wall biosynthesis